MFVSCYFSRTVFKSFNLINLFAYKCNINSLTKGPHKGTEKKTKMSAYHATLAGPTNKVSFSLIFINTLQIDTETGISVTKNMALTFIKKFYSVLLKVRETRSS